MKLSFSTLGCPDWTLSEILSSAKDLQYDGVEFRGLGEEISLPRSDSFCGGNLELTIAQLREKGLEVPCISTECELHLPGKETISSVLAYIALAARLGAPYIRVLGDKNPAPGGADISLVEANLSLLAPEAGAAGVTLLLESNGVFADSEVLRRTVLEVDSPHLGVLWDLNHPYRYFGETPERTYSNIGEFVCHVHVKDSIMENGRLACRVPGRGDLPLESAFRVLKNGGYDGYLSLEWTKRWDKGLEDAGIVFPHFVYFARELWERV